MASVSGGSMYLYIWPLLALLAHLFQKREESWFWAVLTGAYGLFFGALCALPYLVICTAWHAALVWWVAGIPHDITHGNLQMQCSVWFCFVRFMER